MKSSLKATLARELGISRGSLYYKPKKPDKDWSVKVAIEEALREHPAYGHKRLALHLHMNKKKVLRVMKLYGIKPYRRHGRKWLYTKNTSAVYPNLLMTTFPTHENHIWVSDFTYLKWRKKTVYASTVMDLYTGRIIGLNVLTNHSVQLTVNALLSALLANPRPEIFHSDNGSEYDAKDFKTLLGTIGTQISRSKKGCPWENGYQESFYDKFKVDLGDPNRFETLVELVSAIYQTIHYYNHDRIHSRLKMSPEQFAIKHRLATLIDVE